MFDIAAALHLLFQGKVKSALAVFEAYRDFLKMSSSYRKIRQENLRRTIHTPSAGIYRGSMILAYYLRNKRTYTALFPKGSVATRNEK